MDIWHRVGRVVRIQNLGTLIFFCLNLGLLILILFPYSASPDGLLLLITIYVASVLISLSPIGEWVLSVLAGAKDIKRKDIKIRLIPLLEIVFGQAKKITPSMIDSINLKIIQDPSPNAYAIGRKTICVTDSLLELSDNEIMAVFAHEVGHLAYHHSAIQLLIGGGNILIAGFFLILKAISWMITGLFALVGLSTRSIGRTILFGLIGGISTFLIWLWTKFCMLFLMWSMRQNEYLADEYAYKLGYGNILAYLLDQKLSPTPQNGLLKALYAKHPSNDDRIARLQELGATYSRW